VARTIAPQPLGDRPLQLLNLIFHAAAQAEALAPCGAAQREALALCRDRLNEAHRALAAFMELRRVSDLAPLTLPSQPSPQE